MVDLHQLQTELKVKTFYLIVRLCHVVYTYCCCVLFAFVFVVYVLMSL